MENKTQRKAITEDTVRYVARLSRLSFGDAETSLFRDQLSRILDYIDKLNEVDTEGVQPTTHALSSLKNVFREDEFRASLAPEEALGNAPARKGDFFKVPRIIKDA